MATYRKRNGKWQVQVRRTGHKPVSRSFSTKKDAEAWARQLELLADRNELPSDPKVLQRLTLKELVERYRDTIIPRKRRAKIEQTVLNAFLRHPICSRRVADLSPAHFAAYRDERLTSVKPATVKRELGPIRNLFTIAKAEWALPIRENPLSGLTIENGDVPRERRLQEGELDRLLSASRTCRNRLVWPIICFAIETGMRRGEILAMRWTDVDLATRTVLIPQTKTGHPRRIVLSSKAISILEELDPPGGRPFPVSANALRLSWERLRARAGLRDFRIHDLRHEAISRFFEQRLTIPEVASISGHRDPRMLFRYAHADRQAIVSKLDGAQTKKLKDRTLIGVP